MKKKDLANYVSEQNSKLKNQKIGKFEIFFKDAFDKQFDYAKAFKSVDFMLPDHFLELIDIVYVGSFDHFKNGSYNAAYENGAVYVSNLQDNVKDLIDDLIHEIAHAVEEAYDHEVYSDKMIQKNFLAKRKKIESILDYEGYDLSGVDFMNPYYSKNMDIFLRDEVGYETLHNLIPGLFLAPYSISSLREYFARGFEEFYLGKLHDLKTTCPYIFNKIVSLHDNKEREEYEF
tara:strand:- start:3379 stop:4074 length:696 start_codon:yes stop_codon:yes gene_type:complete